VVLLFLSKTRFWYNFIKLYHIQGPDSGFAFSNQSQILVLSFTEKTRKYNYLLRNTDLRENLGENKIKL